MQEPANVAELLLTCLNHPYYKAVVDITMNMMNLTSPMEKLNRTLAPEPVTIIIGSHEK